MSLWFVLVYLDEDDEIVSVEMRGQFESETHRSDAIDEARADDSDARLIIIPIDVEGDDEAVLEVSE